MQQVAINLSYNSPIDSFSRTLLVVLSFQFFQHDEAASSISADSVTTMYLKDKMMSHCANPPMNY